MARFFHFKQFSVTDDRSTMKVGTDGVLLGVWADVEGAWHVLDIGAGCGVIALCLAQRSSARIDAIDIHKESVEEARENFNRSPWKNQLNANHTRLQNFEGPESGYDLIVSNPPYFTNFHKAPDDRRNLARHTDNLSFGDLIANAHRLMTSEGRFSVVLPVDEGRNFIEMARLQGLYIERELIVIPRLYRRPNRILMEFTKQKTNRMECHTITLRNEDGSFHREYMEFTSDFYLDF
ncbi:MAG: methyltransferase [Bacteroidales bacterium]|nr:methyltransferase [Bacteroidales bacterium]